MAQVRNAIQKQWCVIMKKIDNTFCWGAKGFQALPITFQDNTFCWGAKGFQALPITFHCPIKLLTFYFFFKLLTNFWQGLLKPALEKVQEKAVKMVTGLEGENYQEKCAEISLETLEKRRERER